MSSQIKKNTTDLDLNIKEYQPRPNIDNLIKNIMTERRREKKKNYCNFYFNTFWGYNYFFMVFVKKMKKNYIFHNTKMMLMLYCQFQKKI